MRPAARTRLPPKQPLLLEGPGRLNGSVSAHHSRPGPFTHPTKGAGHPRIRSVELISCKDSLAYPAGRFRDRADTTRHMFHPRRGMATCELLAASTYPRTGWRNRSRRRSALSRSGTRSPPAAWSCCRGPPPRQQPCSDCPWPGRRRWFWHRTASGSHRRAHPINYGGIGSILWG